ncbi:MAG: hypothetical protein IPP15_13275 [Saprospiraceae bacterium]|uniref:Uncharacterized protein n=1 Tax=Candidatus Opimibacter skivensis TaxID=2982028 RepID=A0A9D7SUD7_9BACT|nr:hypothetical protein [Candidatus Opimibacter skivensis]
MVKRPFNPQARTDEHRHELKPPVGNRNLYHDAGDYIVMVVAVRTLARTITNETKELY